MPHSAHGKVCYVQIPATDVERSAAFYERVFAGRPPAAEPGLLIVQPIGGDAPELTARFLDPGGNVIGLSEEPS